MEQQSFERISRINVSAIDDILGQPFPVLNDGFVRVVDYMGSDDAIVQAARVSYGKGTKKISEDRGLIRYLMRHQHTTPFEMCEVKLHIRIPMDCWRQWIRHRTANVNEYSTRYSLAIDSTQKTKDEQWRLQSGVNKQGSSDYASLGAGSHFSEQEKMLHETSWKIYNERINAGIAKEQARKDLPLSTYTEAYWKIDLHNLLHFLLLRMNAHAQLEIRKYATIIGNEIVKRWCPVTWAAFEDYQLSAMKLSGIETNVVNLLSTDSQKLKAYLIELKFLDENGIKTKNRERDELEVKLKMLGLHIPWQ